MIPNHGRLSLQLDAFLNQLVPRSIIESLPPTSQALAPAFAPTAAPWNYLRKYTPRTQSWLSTRHQHRPPSLQISAYAQWYPFVCAALLSPSPLAFTSIHAHGTITYARRQGLQPLRDEAIHKNGSLGNVAALAGVELAWKKLTWAGRFCGSAD
ncbi:hypothetical protein VE00_11141 [Pseudogymnoascus sp. WSF 3629]|nr:hypothetical protein VE00_11141 [Pseudogymnoascus sp. WSF 3629]